MALLRVIVGPDVGASAAVDKSLVTIGRSPECGLRVTDEHVSLIHAAVEPFETGYRIRDLESLGGTGVNGDRVLDRRLAFGDVIKVGATLILFGSGQQTADAETIGSAEAPAPGGVEAR